MILAHGKLYESNSIIHILKKLPSDLEAVLSKEQITSAMVVNACNRLSIRIQNGEFQDIFRSFLNEQQLQLLVYMLSKECLYYKLKNELKMSIHNPRIVRTPKESMIYTRQLEPLGVLFHIAAGNMDGLPAYSVIEGLLTCNINLLKLPKADHSITIRLLMELIKEEPALANYIYVVDTPSTDLKVMKHLANLSNAIVLWGSDETIKAVRSLAKPNTKIIEWGHKISFAYVTKEACDESQMKLLAEHILSTKQLLCSSCQGIYLDTNQYDEVVIFAKQFFQILCEVATNYPEVPVGVRAQVSLLQYNRKLENYNDFILKKSGVSVTVCCDNELVGSYTYGNLWIKPLPNDKIVHTLYKHTGHLQTVGICCTKEQENNLMTKLVKAGITRITPLDSMSELLVGESHDGEYPLSRYVKIVEIRRKISQ